MNNEEQILDELKKLNEGITYLVDEKKARSERLKAYSAGVAQQFGLEPSGQPSGIAS